MINLSSHNLGQATIKSRDKSTSFTRIIGKLEILQYDFRRNIGTMSKDAILMGTHYHLENRSRQPEGYTSLALKENLKMNTLESNNCDIHIDDINYIPLNSAYRANEDYPSNRMLSTSRLKDHFTSESQTSLFEQPKYDH